LLTVSKGRTYPLDNAFVNCI